MAANDGETQSWGGLFPALARSWDLMPRVPLERAVRDPGFTPSVRDIGALIELLANDSVTRHAERAITRVGVAALETLRERYERAVPPLRARIVRAIGRFADDASARATLIEALDDPDARTRRAAAIALGHARAEGVEDALLRTWDRDRCPEMRRSIAASLGKVGTARSLAVLCLASPGEDAELQRLAERATMMIERTQSRAERGRLDPARIPARSLDVVVRTRRGLEELLVEELALAKQVDDVRAAGPGQVRARLDGPMNALFVARTMLSFHFPLPTEWLSDGDTLEEAVTRVAAGDEARSIFSTWTVGATRYRIAWAAGGHKRALTWRTAQAIARRAPDMVNDPTASLWELSVVAARRFVDVAIVPRALHDPRFAWRRRDVPAASHPTIAAALARVARVRSDDVVWDPFVGAGAELIERALAGPYASLVGSDVDSRALVAARENLEAAGVPALLEQHDALSHTPRGVTLVVTNPPMGRRASRIPRLAEMLDRFVGHVASVLAPGGRLVWIAPWPKRARAAAAHAGLVLEWARLVDMGGFDAEMQRWNKRK
jgi:23S rRNA G2445 N2-methylase RlmL